MVGIDASRLQTVLLLLCGQSFIRAKYFCYAVHSCPLLSVADTLVRKHSGILGSVLNSPLFSFQKHHTLLWLSWRKPTVPSHGTICKARSRATLLLGELLAGTYPWAWFTTKLGAAILVSQDVHPFVWARNLQAKKFCHASSDLQSFLCLENSHLEKEMRMSLLFKVSVSKVSGCWWLILTRIWHISCFSRGGASFSFHLSPLRLSGAQKTFPKWEHRLPQVQGGCSLCRTLCRSKGWISESQKGWE